MSDEEMREIRESITTLVVGQATNAAVLSTMRDDVSELKQDVKALNELKGGLRAVRWGTSIAAAVIASLSTLWIAHGPR